VNGNAVQQSLGAWRDQILSKLYVGWVQGFCDTQRAALQHALEKFNEGKTAQETIEFEFDHPRAVLEQLANDLRDSKNAVWLQ
jgi:CRISPR-associated protein Cst2